MMSVCGVRRALTGRSVIRVECRGLEERPLARRGAGGSHHMKWRVLYEKGDVRKGEGEKKVRESN